MTFHTSRFLNLFSIREVLQASSVIKSLLALTSFMELKVLMIRPSSSLVGLLELMKQQKKKTRGQWGKV